MTEPAGGGALGRSGDESQAVSLTTSPRPLSDVRAEVMAFVRMNPSSLMDDLFDALSPQPRITRSELRDALSHLVYVGDVVLDEHWMLTVRKAAQREPSLTVRLEHLWRCPTNGRLYARPDECDSRCWAKAGEQEKHQPVTRVTTIELHEGRGSGRADHEGDE